MDTDRRFRLLVSLIVVPSLLIVGGFALISGGVIGGNKGTTQSGPSTNGGLSLAAQPTRAIIGNGENGVIATAAPKPTATGGHDTTAMPAQATTPAVPHTPYDAALPALLPLVPGTTNVRTLTLTVTEQTAEIAPGVRFAEWNFGGTVPAPVVHVKQDDTVQFTLENTGTMPHSIDFHAAQVPPSVDYIDVKPNASFAFDWKADYPGVFMYHCGSPLVIAHMASGMYGAVVVDPPTPLPTAREYMIVQSEFYVTGKQGEVQTLDVDKALKAEPDYVTYNGYENQYNDTPLAAKVGERVRLYIVNAGPSEFSAFHVIGTIFENAYADGNPANVQHGMQTVTIPPGGAYMVEFTIPEEGTYPFVTHSFADVNKGALGVLKVTK